MEVGATFVSGSNRVSFFFKERPQLPRTNKIKSREARQFFSLTSVLLRTTTVWEALTHMAFTNY